jgi:hypothetical protein
MCVFEYKPYLNYGIHEASVAEVGEATEAGLCLVARAAPIAMRAETVSRAHCAGCRGRRGRWYRNDCCRSRAFAGAVVPAGCLLYGSSQRGGGRTVGCCRCCRGGCALGSALRSGPWAGNVWHAGEGTTCAETSRRFYVIFM